MAGYWSRFDLWHTILTLVPVVAAVLGCLVIRRWPERLGTVVLAYAVVCIGDALSPYWLSEPAWAMDIERRPVLVETKLAFVLGLMALLAAGGSAPRRAAAFFALWVLPASLAGQSTTEAPVTRGAFASLSWLSGRWVGSGGGYAAFYEEYRFLNDSTIEQRTFPDSAFSTPDGVSTIEWRAGAARKIRRGAAETRIARVAGDTVRFEPLVPGRMGFTWIRVSANEWRAILDGRNGPTIYALRRFGR